MNLDIGRDTASKGSNKVLRMVSIRQTEDDDDDQRKPVLEKHTPLCRQRLPYNGEPTSVNIQ